MHMSRRQNPAKMGTRKSESHEEKSYKDTGCNGRLGEATVWTTKSLTNRESAWRSGGVPKPQRRLTDPIKEVPEKGGME